MGFGACFDPVAGWPGIAVPVVAPRLDVGRNGKRTVVIGSRNQARLAAASSVVGGGKGVASARWRMQRRPARAIRKPLREKKSPALVPVVMSALRRPREVRCRSSVAGYVVRLCVACSSVSRVGDDALSNGCDLSVHLPDNAMDVAR